MARGYISEFYVGDSDSDDELGRTMTPSELKEYNEMIKEGEGYDIDPVKFRDKFGFGMIHAILEISGDDEKGLNRLSCYALKQHNEEKGMELELVRIIKANEQCAGRGFRYYITLEAKDRKEDNPTVYQLCVWEDFKEIDVEEFRVKPSSPIASSSPPPLLSAL